jgi:hypothetical protein
LRADLGSPNTAQRTKTPQVGGNLLPTHGSTAKITQSNIWKRELGVKGIWTIWVKDYLPRPKIFLTSFPFLSNILDTNVLGGSVHGPGRRLHRFPSGKSQKRVFSSCKQQLSPFGSIFSIQQRIFILSQRFPKNTPERLPGG